MRKRSLFLVLVMSLAAGVLGSAGASVRWVSTATRDLSLEAPDLGRAPGGERLRISVSLSMRNRSEADRLIERLSAPGTPEFGRFLTPSQVTQRFGPSATGVDAVVRYLYANGFGEITVAPNRLLVDAEGTVAQVERAFDTRIERWALGGAIVHTNVTPARVPASLGGVVSAVLGLSNLPMHLPLRTPAQTPDLTGFEPNALLNAYDAASLKPASDVSLAIVAMGDLTGVISTLRYAEKTWHFPVVPVQVEYAVPKTLITQDNPISDHLEWYLDTQMSTMMAGSVKRLVIYDIATFTDPDVARAVNMFVTQDKADAISISLGECDYIAFLDGAMNATDQILQEGALQGQSAFASTGDNGYACPEVASTGVPEGPPGVSWPSSGEYTTAAGGTTLIADANGTVTQELAWLGGGGGISAWEVAAPWTLRANPAGQAWVYDNQGGRGVPDVAAVADGNTPVLVYGSGNRQTPVGGTSVSSPLLMGLWARIVHAKHHRAGLASYFWYRLYNKTNPGTFMKDIFELPHYAPAVPAGAVPGFRDITAGTNGLWVAAPGWDYTTGIGVLDTAKLATE